VPYYSLTEELAALLQILVLIGCHLNNMTKDHRQHGVCIRWGEGGGRESFLEGTVCECVCGWGLTHSSG
jgi:hypothetical protein